VEVLVPDGTGLMTHTVQDLENTKETTLAVSAVNFYGQGLSFSPAHLSLPCNIHINIPQKLQILSAIGCILGVKSKIGPYTPTDCPNLEEVRNFMFWVSKKRRNACYH